MADTATEAFSANITAMKSNRYTWLRETRRQNGELAGLIRNIEDLGDLIGSQELHQVSPGTFALTWGGERAPHAASVFFGATTKSGTHLPARKWIYEAIRGGSGSSRQWRNSAAILNISDYFAARYRHYAAS